MTDQKGESHCQRWSRLAKQKENLPAAAAAEVVDLATNSNIVGQQRRFDGAAKVRAA